MFKHPEEIIFFPFLAINRDAPFITIYLESEG